MHNGRWFTVLGFVRRHWLCSDASNSSEVPIVGRCEPTLRCRFYRKDHHDGTMSCHSFEVGDVTDPLCIGLPPSQSLDRAHLFIFSAECNNDVLERHKMNLEREKKSILRGNPTGQTI